jgi:hypothetical protein
MERFSRAAAWHSRAEIGTAYAALQAQKIGYSAEGASKFNAGRPQISSAYSRIVRSDENQPMRATFRIEDEAQPGVAHCASTRRCVR